MKPKKLFCPEGSLMKTLLVTLTATLACAPGFAQGKIQFANDSLHLVYWDPTYGPPLGGQPLTLANAPVTPIADLYVGTSSGTLSLLSSTTFSSTPGEWNPL